MRRLPRWLAALPLSVAIHAALVVIAVALLRTESTEPALILDLNAIIAARDDGPAQESPLAGPGTPPPAGQRAVPVAPRRPSAPSRPTPAPPATPSPRAEPRATPEPVTAARPPEPPSAPAPDPATMRPDVPAPSPSVPSAAVAPTDAATPTPRPPGGRGADSVAARGDASAGSAEGAAGQAGGRTSGEHLAAVAPGAGGGTGAGVGSEYAGYLARLRQRIQESLRYPAAARRRGVSGTVQLEIAIAPDGAIANVSVVASSSHEVLDRAAVDAARSLPRVPFPADVRSRALTVRLPVVFELQ